MSVQSGTNSPSPGHVPPRPTVPAERLRDYAEPRLLLDAADTWWEVVELDTRTTPGARAPTCLCFVSQAAIRRVWRYPAHWATLPAEELLRLAQNP